MKAPQLHGNLLTPFHHAKARSKSKARVLITLLYIALEIQLKSRSSLIEEFTVCLSCYKQHTMVESCVTANENDNLKTNK